MRLANSAGEKDPGGPQTQARGPLLLLEPSGVLRRMPGLDHPPIDRMLLSAGARPADPSRRRLAPSRAAPSRAPSKRREKARRPYPNGVCLFGADPYTRRRDSRKSRIVSSSRVELPPRKEG